MEFRQLPTADDLRRLGLFFPVAAGIQHDVNAVLNDGKEASLCDHNCTREVGNYDCPAAFSTNHGAKKPFAPAPEILFWIDQAARGLRAQIAETFSGKGRFGEYGDEFEIPLGVRTTIRNMLEPGAIEVNLFGGNPEMHPEIVEIIQALKRSGFRVNLTTTGRRIMTDAAFEAALAASPPHLLALSADDMHPAKLAGPLALTALPEIKKFWQSIGKLHGQEQKLVEAIYATRFFEGNSEVKILYNMVLHRGNLPYAEQLIEQIATAFPGTLVNPYPMQSSFLGGGDRFTQEELPIFSRLVDRMIALSHEPTSPITKRLHYWLVMKAILLRYPPDTAGNAAIAGARIAGHDTWRCYKAPLIPYLQIGKGPLGKSSSGRYPGGKLGCFWNATTVTETSSIENVDQVRRYLDHNMQFLAHDAKLARCSGCVMPRLMFNMMTTELGLEEELVPHYLALRKQHVGF